MNVIWIKEQMITNCLVICSGDGKVGTKGGRRSWEGGEGGEGVRVGKLL